MIGITARALAGYSGQAVAFIGQCFRAVGSGLVSSPVAAARAVISSGTPDNFFTFMANGGWKGVAAGALIGVPTAVMNLTNFFEDGRRIREIASGQSNFYTDRDASAKTWGLSALGLGATSTAVVTGLAMGATAFNPVGMSITAATGVVATGALIARGLYKYFTIDLPQKANATLGMFSMNRPIFRVNDPNSKYYMMSHMLEKTVANRTLQDAKYGELGSKFGRKLEKIGLAISNYLTGSKYSTDLTLLTSG